MTVWPDFPMLCATLGYDTTTTLLLRAPPWAFATIVAFALHCTLTRSRGVTNTLLPPLAMHSVPSVAFITSIFTMNKGGPGRQSCALYFVVPDGSARRWISGALGDLGWVNNTFAREPAKRAVAIALINTIGQIGNIVGPYAWPSKWGPTCRYSYAVGIAAIGVSTTMLGGMHLYLKHLNEQIERNENAKGIKEHQGAGPVGFRYLV
ncbi:uncharacterized protein F5147DRAFT_241316 [Suillus discolor]|uniref:Uncharacterized protein n=1 Tax=Suillus discolor TaxID=1912936 RepID=A0A9P7JSJ6_9AGAM|nr:uncharacterized protein F5147DRAFT_241316 [Suillus discolor]KAG2105466.1 hypothetical protein F5147DRAFT_241316 [Suillus discolor]